MLVVTGSVGIIFLFQTILTTDADLVGVYDLALANLCDSGFSEGGYQRVITSQ